MMKWNRRLLGDVSKSLAMSDSKQAAQSYQEKTVRQREDGKSLMNDVEIHRGDVILDLGCGTGELSAYLAELVGQDGRVVAVDPDVNRLQVAQESHGDVKNLAFHEGSSSNFPRMGSETYDIVFANSVFQRIQDKEEAFKNMFRSLKPAGKIALSYGDHFISGFQKIYGGLQNSEMMELMLSKLYFERRSKIEGMCSAAGFDIVKSVDVKMKDFEFENVESMCSFYSVYLQDAFDPKLVTKDKLSSFCAQYTSGINSTPLKMYTDEEDYYCILIAAKS